MFNAAKVEPKIKELPEKPGVYIMKDARGEIIYVGKAVILKRRVTQYFRSSPKPAKVQAMVDNVDDFEYIVTLTEADALVLESTLIKKHMPRYNILLKDDKGPQARRREILRTVRRGADGERHGERDKIRLRRAHLSARYAGEAGVSRLAHRLVPRAVLGRGDRGKVRRSRRRRGGFPVGQG